MKSLSMLRDLIPATSLVFILCVGGCTEDTMGDAGDAGETGGVQGDAVRGETLYGQSCASCHSADGKGGIDIDGTLSADLTFEINDLTDEELADVIKNGIGTAMPAQLQDEQDIADVIAYMHATFE